MQRRGADDLKKLMTDGLVEAGLTYESAGAFATPRRLALSVNNLLVKSPTTVEERKGPRVDAPDQAIDGFLRSTGLTRNDLEVRDDKKGRMYFAKITSEGRPAAEIVAETLETVVRNFPWPKSMRWGTGSLKWVRPLHSILAILTDEDGVSVVPLDIDGIASNDTTFGHRFMAPSALRVGSFEDYEAKLKRSFVVLRSDERAEQIWNDAEQFVFAQGLELVEDKGLLAEVAGLVEWPTVLMGDIEEEFLGLPPEVLQASMREHQKFFSVRNPKTGRIEKYITVANRETEDNGTTILAGNSKVLAARLADAKFFWENDLRVANAGMDEWTRKLGSVTFHNKLGTVAEKIDRVALLARVIAPRVGVEVDQAEKAVRIAKADLSSEMVYEFPELQGVMGKYYAKASGLSDEMAAVAEDHYAPLGPSDDVPTAPLSVAVALADKIDTLTGFWAIDEKPTGSKDPFALRRAALGIIRIILNGDLRLSLIEEAQAAFEPNVRAALARDDSTSAEQGPGDRDDGLEKAKSLLTFIHDRLKVYLRDQGIRHDVIDASIAMPGSDDLTLLVKRAHALQDFLNSDDGENLLQGFKRANNILTAEEKKDGIEYSLDPDPKFADTAEEKALFKALDEAQPNSTKAVSEEDFAKAMAAMASLRAPIDTFFEAVQVNTDNDIVRRNRLCLLNRIRVVMNGVADFTLLEG